MTMFSELLDGITITAKSPDNNIIWELEDGRRVEMAFEDDSYREYTERELERQLAELMRAMWAGHRQAHLSVMSEMAGFTVKGGSPHGDRRSREFVEEREKVHAGGKSPTERIRMATVGLREWTVSVRPGTIRQLDEDAFLHDFWSAFLALMDDYSRRMSVLKRDTFGTPDIRNAGYWNEPQPMTRAPQWRPN